MVLKGKEEIKAIIFDVGGVLALDKKSILLTQKFTKTKGVHEFVAKKLRIPLDQWFDSIDSIYSDAIEGKASKKKTLKIISKNNKISSEKLEKILIQSYENHFKQNKQLFNRAFKLKQKGYKIAVLSDQWPVSKEALMPKKLYKHFNKVILSCNVGFRKPSPKIYKLIFKKLKIPARHCLFVDNRLWNLNPAKKLGMETILFRNNKQLFKNPIWIKLWKTR